MATNYTQLDIEVKREAKNDKAIAGHEFRTYNWGICP